MVSSEWSISLEAAQYLKVWKCLIQLIYFSSDEQIFVCVILSLLWHNDQVIAK